MHAILNSTNLTEVFNNAHREKCKLELRVVEYESTYSIATACIWAFLLVTSTALNLSTILKIVKRSKFLFHNICLLNLFFANLSVGGFIYLLLILNNLKVRPCFTRNAIYIASYVFTNVSLLSVAAISVNQANKVRHLSKFLAANDHKTKKNKYICILMVIWVYSLVLCQCVALYLPNVGLWFSQILLIFILILVLHCFSIIRLSRVGPLPSTTNVAMFEQRVMMNRRAVRVVIVLLMTEVCTWVPLIICVVIRMTKAFKADVINKALLYSSSVFFLTPALYPMVFFWFSRICGSSKSGRKIDTIERS